MSITIFLIMLITVIAISGFLLIYLSERESKKIKKMEELINNIKDKK